MSLPVALQDPGHFQRLAEMAVGPWMRPVYFIGSQISLYGNSKPPTNAWLSSPAEKRIVWRRSKTQTKGCTTGLYNSTVIVAECTMPPLFEKYFAGLGPSAHRFEFRHCVLYLLTTFVCGACAGFKPDGDGEYRKSKAHNFCLKGKGEEEPGYFYVMFVRSFPSCPVACRENLDLNSRFG